MENIKPIIIHDKDEGKDYTLEFSRASIDFAENHGFKWEDVADYPSTNIPNLFFYSMRMHHRNMSKANTDKLLEKLGGMTEAMVLRLKDLYMVALETTLIDEEELEKNEKMSVEM